MTRRHLTRRRVTHPAARAGSGMTEQLAVPIGDSWVTTDASITVLRVALRRWPRGSPRCRRAARRTSRLGRRDGVPPRRSPPGAAPRSSTPPLVCSPSASRSSPAPSPTKRRSPSPCFAGRSAACRCRRSPSAAVEARALTGEVVPMGRDRRPARASLRVHPARADRRGGRDQPVQLPAQPRRPQGRTGGGRGRMPGRPQAGVADIFHLLRHRARPTPARRLRAPTRRPERRDRSRERGR